MSGGAPDRGDHAPTGADKLAYGIPAPGRPLPAATRVGRVRLRVADLERSLRFYGDVLGFRVVERTARGAALAPYGDDVPLVELEDGADASAARGPRLGLYHFAILVPDRESLGRFVAHLADRRVRFGAGDHFVSEAIYLEDPDGLGIEVYADRPRSQWRTRGRELDIGTAALDLGSLVRAGGGTRWAGMPEGTTMGHVHLSVGDLDRAARFYHGALGFDLVAWSYPGALFVSAGGYHHHLGMNTWAGPRATPPDEREPRLLEWELVLPTREDVDAAARRIEAAGHGVTSGEGGWTAEDPWGTRLRVTAGSGASRG